MATPPSIAAVLSGIEDTANRITQTVPIIRTTVDSVTTIAQGKHPTPAASQQPAAVASTLNSETAAMAASSALVLGGIAVLVILMFAVKR